MTGYYATYAEDSGYRLVFAERVGGRAGRTLVLDTFTTNPRTMERALDERNCSGRILPPADSEIVEVVA